MATATGTYYLQVTSTGSARYSLVVTRNTEPSTKGNNSLATPQDLISPEVGGQRCQRGG